MQFLAPLALLSGLLALVILAFHIRRRRTLNVPSLVIWRQLQAGQVRRNRTWQWPNPSWSLALQLLALLAMVMALSQPLWNRGPPVDHWIFVVDRSGAMQAQAGAGSLLDEVKADLRDHITGAAGAGRQSLVAVGADVTPVAIDQALTGSAMADAVGSLAAEHGHADWSRLKAALAPIIRPNEKTRIVIYSDHAVTPDFGRAEISVEPVIVASQFPNAAISATLEASTKVANRWTLSGTVRLDPGQAAAEMIVGFATRGDEQPLEWTRRTIATPNEPDDAVRYRTFSVTLELPGAGIVSATLADDGNAYDNAARFVIGAQPKPLDVLYIGAGNQPLLSAFRAIEGTQIFQAPRLPNDVSAYGLVVVDGSFVDRQPETNTLWIGNAGIEGETLATGSSLPPTSAIDAHPLMRGVTWTGIDTGGSVVLPVTETAEILLRTGDAPLITTDRTPFGRSIALAFDPRQSNWPQQPSLPIFTANLVDWLGIAPQPVLQPSCVAGARCALDRRLEGGTLTLLGGDAQASAKMLPAGWVPTVAGLYQVERNGLAKLIAVNPDIVPPGVDSVATFDEPASFPLPLWPFFIGLAIAALIAEAIVSGRGAERFLQREGLRSSNPLSQRRRIALGLHVATLALAMAALVNAPLPWRQAGEYLVQLASAGGAPDADMVDRLIAAGPVIAMDTTEMPERIGPLANAIALAAASVPWGEPGHIVVTGQTATDDDAFQAVSDTLRDRDIVLEVIAPPFVEDAVLVSALEAPEPVFVGDTVQLVGIVHARDAAPAHLRFERDGAVLVDQQVALQAGDNRVETILTDLAAGPATYTLSVTSAADDTPANNSLTRLIDVGDAGDVAVIATDPARASQFIAWLGGQGITGTAIEPKRVPYKQEDWARYDGAVLIDLPAIALTTLQQEQLTQAVAEQGMGLLMLGGPNSFGPGGYLQTPLDDASPLSSRVPRDAPEATLVFVLDRSGSMQQPVGNGTRLDVAKQATLAAVRLLNRNSQVGIIVFDSEPITVLPLSRISDPNVVSTALSGVDPGGGTSVYPGLEAAYDMLSNVDTPARHIIVMTDGLSQPADFAGLLNQIRGSGITVSTVSIGEGAERGLIEQIARMGGGTFHATNDFAALPSILSQEAMLLSGSPIETGITQPLWASRSEPFLRGLPPTMPTIDGFVLTTAKPEAQLSMVVPDNKGEPMPLLASWRFGAGQVLALTTEAVGPWSSRWQSLESYAPFWAQVVRQFLPGVERGDLVLDLVRRGDGIVVDLTLRDAELGAPSLAVFEGDTLLANLPLDAIGAEKYRAVFYPQVAGTYRFEAKAGDVMATSGLTMNYPAALGMLPPDRAIQHLAQLSGGRTDLATPTRRDVPDRWVMRPASPLWLGLAILLFMAALCVRYTRLFAPRQKSTSISPPAASEQSRSNVEEAAHV